MIYPRQLKLKYQEEKTVSQKLKSFLSWVSFQPESTKEDIILNKFEAPEMEDMRWKCLKFYIKYYLDIFKTGTMSSSEKPIDVINTVRFIYWSLRYPLIQDGSTSRYVVPRTSTWTSTRLEEVCYIACFNTNLLQF